MATIKLLSPIDTGTGVTPVGSVIEMEQGTADYLCSVNAAELVVAVVTEVVEAVAKKAAKPAPDVATAATKPAKK